VQAPRRAGDFRFVRQCHASLRQAPRCHYCAIAWMACDVSAIFSTPGSMLPKGARHRKFHASRKRRAREILVINEGPGAPRSPSSTVRRERRRDQSPRSWWCVAPQWNPRSAAQFTIELSGPRQLQRLVRRFSRPSRRTGPCLLEDLAGLPPFNQDGHRSRLHPRYEPGPTMRVRIQVIFQTTCFRTWPVAQRVMRGIQRARCADEPGFLISADSGRSSPSPTGHRPPEPCRTRRIPFPWSASISMRAM